MRSFLPPAASAHAAHLDVVMTAVHALMLVLFVGWALYFVVVLVRFRSTRQPRADRDGAKGRIAVGVEVAVVVAEVALLVGLALPVWFTRTGAAPTDPRAVVIRVVAEQFNWNVQYPGADGRFGDSSLALISGDNPLGLDRASRFGRDDIVELNAIHVPVGRLVVIQLSSKDVIHSFGVAAMRVKQDAIPGTLATVWFTPVMTGTFDIQCSQLCGLGHYRMHGLLTVESEDAFQKYLASEAALEVTR